MVGPEPLERLEFESSALAADFPPVLRDRNKRVVHSICCPEGCVHKGRIHYSRWPALLLSERVDVTGALERIVLRENLYDYKPVWREGKSLEWHVNFADPHLFTAYGSSLFAQDEMQVAEHPILGSLREAILSRGLPALTVEDGSPTPVVIADAERRCMVKTDANPDERRPYGLYGNNFGRADEETVRKATVPIEPPTVTKFIAMAAPSGGYGPYSREDVEYVLKTAFTGFTAAGLETKRLAGVDAAVVVHTGFWGCGAFGGNRELMALLQILAAVVSELDMLVFHTHRPAGTEVFTRARQKAADLAKRGETGLDELLPSIVDLGYRWGQSDGN
ncbi:MAG: hypothetical protein ACP5DY_06215 [Thermovirgaceae bacterium]